MKHLLAILLLSSFLVACSDSEPGANPEAGQTSSTANQSPDPDAELEIAWFDGSVEAAFAQAKQDNRPLYLYWGAVWCPPCEELKHTVFKSPSFIYQSRLFVPVYLDGDTARAQSWGEHFGVAGYPTMIVFNPAGEEVTRIPGGIDVQRYAEVLGLSLERLKSTPELIALAQQKPSALGTGDFLQLAFYSWEQANLDLEGTDVAALLLRLAGEAKARNKPELQLAGSRLLAQGLALFSLQNEAELSPQARADYQAQLATLLNEPSRVLANLDVLSFYCAEIMALVTQPGANREALSKQWVAAMTQARQSEQISTAENLASWYPAIHFYWLDHPDAEALPAELAQALQTAINTADETTKGSARQSVIHRASRVLQAAKMLDESHALLTAEVQKQPDSYYFLSSLGEVEEMLGNDAAAISRMQEAYAKAQGKATRFQWGVDYLSVLIRLAPERKVDVLTTADAVLAELPEADERFVGRNFGRLQTLTTSLQEWAANQGEDREVQVKLAQINNELQQQCETLPEQSQGRDNCNWMLAAENETESVETAERGEP